MEEAEFVKTMSRIVHSQGEEFRPFFEEAIGLIKEEFAEEIDLKSGSVQVFSISSVCDVALITADMLSMRSKSKSIKR